MALAALDRRKWIAEHSRTEVAAMLKRYGKSSVLSAPQRELLQRALLEYEEDVSRYRTTLCRSRHPDFADARERMHFLPVRRQAGLRQLIKCPVLARKVDGRWAGI